MAGNGIHGYLCSHVLAHLLKVLKEGRLKNILTHLKKHGAPVDAEEAAAEAAAAAARLALAEAQQPFKLLPVDKAAQLDVEHIHPEVKGVFVFVWGSVASQLLL